jgi:hypothetical protein
MFGPFCYPVTASIFYLKIEDNIFVISIVYNNMDAEKNQVEKSIKCNTCREVRSSKYFCWRGTQYYPKCKYCMRDARLKQCSKCLDIKSLDCFYYRQARNTYQSFCRECKNKRDTAYRNRPEVKVRNNTPERKEYLKEKSQKYRNDPENVEKLKKYREERRANSEIRQKEYEVNKQYRANPDNREKIRKMKRDYERKRKKEDVGYKIKNNLRNRIRDALNGTNKSEKTMDLMGCDIEFFKIWLEFLFDENMSWENYGSYWHMDHVKPCELFDMTEEEEQKLCFHWTNIQPLEGNENKSKGISYNETIKNNHQYVLKEFCEENGIDMTMIIDTLCYI